MQVARYCLLAGDLSPLFMIPASSQNPLDDHVVQQYGYIDTLTWGLGDELAPPTYADDIWVSDANDLVRLKAEHLGVVTSVRREKWSWLNDWNVFHVNLKITLESMLDLNNTDSLVDTLCVRLYGLPPRAVHARLAADPHRLQLPAPALGH